MIPRRDDSVPLAKYEDPDLYFPLFTALQVSLNRGRKKQTHFSPILFYHQSKLNCLKNSKRHFIASTMYLMKGQIFIEHDMTHTIFVQNP